MRTVQQQKKQTDISGWETKSEILLHAVCSALFPVFYFIH